MHARVGFAAHLPAFSNRNNDDICLTGCLQSFIQVWGFIASQRTALMKFKIFPSGRYLQKPAKIVSTSSGRPAEAQQPNKSVWLSTKGPIKATRKSSGFKGSVCFSFLISTMDCLATSSISPDALHLILFFRQGSHQCKAAQTALRQTLSVRIRRTLWSSTSSGTSPFCTSSVRYWA